MIFLTAILATVIYLSITRADVIEGPEAAVPQTASPIASGPCSGTTRSSRSPPESYWYGRTASRMQRRRPKPKAAPAIDHSDRRRSGRRPFPGRRRRELPHHRPGHADEVAGRRPERGDGESHRTSRPAGTMRSRSSRPWTTRPGRPSTAASTPSSPRCAIPTRTSPPRSRRSTTC